MLKVYTSYNCSSCRKVMDWFHEYGLVFEEYNFFARGLTEQEVIHILKYADNGFEDVISERSKIFAKYKDEIKEMTTKELINFIVLHPSVLKRPIIVDEATETIMSGYNNNDLFDLL